jgi:hypothetical protein
MAVPALYAAVIPAHGRPLRLPLDFVIAAPLWAYPLRIEEADEPMYDAIEARATAATARGVAKLAGAVAVDWWVAGSDFGEHASRLRGPRHGAACPCLRRLRDDARAAAQRPATFAVRTLGARGMMTIVGARRRVSRAKQGRPNSVGSTLHCQCWNIGSSSTAPSAPTLACRVHWRPAPSAPSSRIKHRFPLERRSMARDKLHHTSTNPR